MPASLVGTPVNSGTGLGTTATSISFARPSNTLRPGDIVWAVYAQRGSTAEPLTPPAGWTATGFVSNSNSPGGGSGVWYRRFVTQSEINSDAGSYSASFSARALIVSCGIVKDADSVSLVTTASANGTPTPSLTFASITALASGLGIAWMARNAVDSDPLTNWIAPSGFGELLEYNAFTTQEVSQGISTRSFPSGATGTVTYNYSFSSGRLSGGFLLFYDNPNPSVDLSGLNASAIASTVAPMPILGSIAIDSVNALAVASTVAPVAVQGAIALSGLSADAVSSTVAPVPMLGSVAFSGLNALAIASTVAPIVSGFDFKVDVAIADFVVTTATISDSAPFSVSISDYVRI